MIRLTYLCAVLAFSPFSRCESQRKPFYYVFRENPVHGWYVLMQGVPGGLSVEEPDHIVVDWSEGNFIVAEGRLRNFGIANDRYFLNGIAGHVSTSERELGGVSARYNGKYYSTHLGRYVHFHAVFVGRSEEVGESLGLIDFVETEVERRFPSSP